MMIMVIVLKLNIEKKPIKQYKRYMKTKRQSQILLKYLTTALSLINFTNLMLINSIVYTQTIL